MRTATLLSLVALGVAIAPAQPKQQKSGELGFPFITWFGPRDYVGPQQVWSFAQDNRGLIYVGASNGVLEYDGTYWRHINTPHNSVVRSLAKGPDGRIFVGEVGDFGYLEPDKSGEMQFRSLLEFIPKRDRDFQDIVKIHSTPEGIYFQARERLIRLTPDGQSWRVKTWGPSGKVFRGSYYAGGKLYLGMTGAGLHRLTNDTLERIPLSNIETNLDTGITFILPLDGNQLLVGMRNGSFFSFDGEKLQPFPVESAGLLAKLRVSNAATLLDGSFAIGTRIGGILIMEKNGKTRQYLDRAAGIPSDGVLNTFVDRAGTLWGGLQNGIAKIEVSSPLSEFGTVTGMSASVNDITRYQGTLHVATISGLLRLDPKSARFEPVAPSQLSSAWGFLLHGDSLLVAGGRDGVFSLTGNSIRHVAKNASTLSHYTLKQSLRDPNRIWLGTDRGLVSIRQDASGNWIDEGIVAPGPVIRTIVEPEPGFLWLGTESQGVVRVRFHGDSLQNPTIERFGFEHGLASTGGTDVLSAAGRLAFISARGVREFDPAAGRFVPSALFDAIPPGNESGGSNQSTDPQGNIWINFGVRPVLLRKQADSTYKVDDSPVRRVGDGRVTWLYVDGESVLWMGGGDRLFRYDPSRTAPTSQRGPALIRRVIAGDRDKTTLYAGGGGPAATTQAAIPFSQNELRFEFAGASLEDSSKNQFQTRLDGFDRDWSTWNTEIRRDYTNLPPGQFRFRVKSRNALLEESTEAAYSLEILPPWYRTWWAYGAYALLLAGGVFLADRGLRARVIARERANSALREAQLRAETAAAEAKTLQAENERNKNVELLSEIGKELTSSLDLDTIFFRLYEQVNQLMDASVFGVGLYHPEHHEIEYRLAVEKGKRYAPYKRDTRDRNQFPVWCIEHRQPVFINNVSEQYSKYIAEYQEPRRTLEDGAAATNAQSLIYLPLTMKDRILGVITVQSFSQNAYTDYDLDLLQNLASYTTIALDNADAYQHLKSAQEQLVVQEKLASLGALTAGIAHEIKNPLNFVNNFADLSVELTAELREEIDKLKNGGQPDLENVDALLDDLSSNAKKINEHGKRADGIVKSMLLHSRGQAGERQPTDINAMLDEYVNLAYHGMRAQDSTFNLKIVRSFADGIGKVDAIPQDLSRVFLNILNNACYAAHDKTKKNIPGFSPVLSVKTINLGEAIEVRIRDNGMGIPPDVREKIFNPFFTTKPTGQGTGLGLSISHDIVVQEHGGQLEVETEAGEFTEFVVRLPRQWRKS